MVTNLESGVLKRKDNDPDEVLKRKIIAIYEQRGKTVGYRRIQDELPSVQPCNESKESFGIDGLEIRTFRLVHLQF